MCTIARTHARTHSIIDNRPVLWTHRRNQVSLHTAGGTAPAATINVRCKLSHKEEAKDTKGNARNNDDDADANSVAMPAPPYAAEPAGASNNVLGALTAELASIAAHGAAQGGDAAVAALTAVLAAVTKASQGRVSTSTADKIQVASTAMEERHVVWRDESLQHDSAAAAAEEAEAAAAAQKTAAEEQLQEQHRQRRQAIEVANEEHLRSERIAANARMLHGYDNDTSGSDNDHDVDDYNNGTTKSQLHSNPLRTPSVKTHPSSKRSRKPKPGAVVAAAAPAASPWASGSVVYSPLQSASKPVASPKPHHQHVPRGKPTQWGAIKRPRIPVHSTKSQQMREALSRPGSAGYSEVTASRDTFGKARSIDGSKVARHKQHLAKSASGAMLPSPARSSAKINRSQPALSLKGPPKIEVRQTRKSQGTTNMTK